MTALFCFQYLRVFEPRSFLWTSKFGHLGAGVPYAIAAKLAQPQRPVVLVTGDSAFGFNIQELETAFREKAPFVCVVSCDYRWGMEAPGQILALGRDNLVGLDHSRARYDKVAEGFGCFGAFVNDPAADPARPGRGRQVGAAGGDPGGGGPGGQHLAAGPHGVCRRRPRGVAQPSTRTKRGRRERTREDSGEGHAQGTSCSRGWRPTAPTT